MYFPCVTSPILIPHEEYIKACSDRSVGFYIKRNRLLFRFLGGSHILQGYWVYEIIPLLNFLSCLT